MEAYIKSYSTFQAFLQRAVPDYNLTLDSISGETSSVTLTGDDIPATANGAWLVLDGAPYFITQITPSKGSTKLTVAPPDEIFNRKMLYDGSSGSSIGAWLASKINSDWKNQSDSMYATPYITVTNRDSTAFVAPEADEDGTFNFLEYIRRVRRDYGVTIRASISGNALRFTIVNDTRSTIPLVLDDGHTKLVSSAFAKSIVAKITVLQPVDTGNVDSNGDKIFNTTQTEWYLAADGTASTTIPSNRAQGEWITLVLSESDEQAEKVMEEFSKNGESHKVEFWSDIEMNVNDRFRMKLNGEVFEGTIIGKYRKKNDNRVFYKSGDLITTIQERARSGGASIATSPKFYFVGDVFTTTRDGNPASLLGYGAWTNIRTSTVSGHTVRDWLRKE